MRVSFQPDLYLVTDRGLSLGRSIEEVVEAAVAGGATMVQLREKSDNTRDFIARAECILAITRRAGIPLLINDRVDVALAIDADGVHLGQDDMPCATARRLLGPDKIIGLSVTSLDDARVAEILDVDYLGVSPVYLTATKPEAEHALGLEGLRAIRAISRHPLVAIGGMNLNTIADVIRAGADGVAVVSAICSAPDVKAATQALSQVIQQTKHERKSS